MGDVVVHFRSQDRADDPSGATFRQRSRSRSHVRYSTKTFLSLVPAGSGGCSTLLAIPAAQRRGTGSRGGPPVGGGNSSPTRFPPLPLFLFPNISRLTFKLAV